MKKGFIFVFFAVLIISGCKIGNSTSNMSSSLKQSRESTNNIDGSSEIKNNSSSYISSSNGNSSSDNKVSSTITSSISTSVNETNIVNINLSLNTEIQNNNGGVIVEGQIITINKAGTYRVQGTLENGSIVINATKEEKVNLILNGVNIASSVNSPLYCLSADKLVIELATDTTNVLTDASSYTYANEVDQEPNACLFSKDDLTIKGNGSLVVNSNFNNGIGTKDDLKISNGVITVSAPNNALKGNDSIQIKGGNIKVTSTAGDGLKTDNVDDTTKGYVEISNGVLDITAKYDGIQSDNYINISGGEVTIKTSNGSTGSISSSDTNSYKGIKATNDINITGGTINVNSLDDSIHSNKNITVSGGECILSSADDGMHADEILHVIDGKIKVLKSYEGLESTQMTIDGGEINIYASDDGVNVAGGDGSNTDWRPGGSGGPGGWWRNNQTLSTTTLDYILTINNGYLYINASGDGLDSNGDIYINGGTIIVNGPTDNGNGAVDYGDSGAKFEIDGGTLIAVGSSGMAVGPTTGSTQYSAKITFSSSSSYSIVTILDQEGDVIIAFTAAKRFSSMVVSHSNFTSGETYTISINGVYDGGNSIGGLYTGGTYSGGTTKSTFSFSSKTTNVTVR